MRELKDARFPLSNHFFRTHFGGGKTFSDDAASGYSPQMMRKAYCFDEKTTGKGVKIAVVSAFDNIGIRQSFDVFCRRFSLPSKKLDVYYPDERAGSTTREWLTESALDTQWAHVFSPDAQMLVVFSSDAEVSNLLSAAEYAVDVLSADIVCMCFGTDESGTDKSLSDFMRTDCIFISSSGDVGGRVSFPSTSPFCVSVGGTNLAVSPSGKRISETAWINGGGGKSEVFEIPPYQKSFFNIYGMADGMRGTPDVSLTANFNPGVPVYVSQLGGWTTVGGTSLSAACFAGICACIKEKHPEIKTGADMLSFLYSKAGGDGYSFLQYNFHDITIGKSGENHAQKGWDFATGLGSPVICRILS